MRTLRYALPLIALVAACQQPTPAPTPRAAQPIAASRETVWASALGVLADRSVLVQSSDKAAGLITTVEAQIAPDDRKHSGECVKSLTGTLRPDRVQYTITVSGDATATVRVAARLTLGNIYSTATRECASSGYLETRLENAIRERAGGSAR